MPANERQRKFYWIKFDGESPIRLSISTFLELMQAVERETMRRGKDFEWLIKDYN